MAKDKKRHWHKRYHSDALTGYRGLTLEQRGAYTTILDLLYDSGEEALPASERWMAGQLDVSTRRWRILRDELVALGKLTLLDDGRVTNRRYLVEREKDGEISAKRADAGAIGGSAKRQTKLPLGDEKPRENVANFPEFDQFSTPENAANAERVQREPSENANNINGASEANASGLPPYARADHMLEARDRRLESSSFDSSQPAGDVWSGDLLAVTNDLAKLAGIAMFKETDRARNMDVVKSWRADGVDLATVVVPIIEKDVADSPDQKRWSLAFYEQAVRRKVATSRGPAAKPPPPPKPMRTKDDADPRVAALRSLLAGLLGKPAYDRWLGPSSAAFAMNGTALVVTSRSPFMAHRVQAEYGTALADAVRDVFGVPVRVQAEQ